MIKLLKRITLKIDEDKEFFAMVIIWIVVNIAIILPLFSQKPIAAERNIILGDLFPQVGAAIEGHLPSMTKETVIEQMQREVDKNVFSFKINSRPMFRNGAGAGSLRIENPSHNVYPFVVKIFLNETSEEIYYSGGILPNHHIDEAKLTRILPKGEHAATAYIYAYDPTTNEYGGKSAVELTLIIIS